MPQVGFVKAMKDYFGLLPGQTVMQFGAELKALTHDDKLDFARGLHAIGIDCAAPEQHKAVA
jgi:hypothetical protein